MFKFILLLLVIIVVILLYIPYKAGKFFAGIKHKKGSENMRKKQNSENSISKEDIIEANFEEIEETKDDKN